MTMNPHKIFASVSIPYKGTEVIVSVNNETMTPTWEYRSVFTYRYAAVSPSTQGAPCLWIEDRQLPQRWAWELLHEYALEYVACGTLPPSQEE